MMLNFMKAICFVFLTCVCFSSADAQVLFRAISSEGTTFAPGDVGTLSFLLEATGADVGQPFSGFQLTAEVTGIDGSDTADFSFTPMTADVDNAFTLATSSIDMAIPSFYSTAIDAGGATLSANTQLVSVEYSIANDASEFGAFIIDIVASGGPVNAETSAFGVDNFSFAASPELTLEGRTIPEPSAVALLTGTCGLLILRRRKTFA